MYNSNTTTYQNANKKEGRMVQQGKYAKGYEVDKIQRNTEQFETSFELYIIIYF